MTDTYKQDDKDRARSLPKLSPYSVHIVRRPGWLLTMHTYDTRLLSSALPIPYAPT